MMKTAEGSDNRETRLYEAAFHLVPVLGGDDLEREVSAVRAIIEKHGGSISSEHFPESFMLAYPLLKRAKGHRQEFETSYFGWIKFDAEGEGADAIRLELGGVSGMLRHTVVKSAFDKKPLIPKRSVFERPPAVLKEEKERVPSAQKGAVSDEALDRELERLVAE